MSETIIKAQDLLLRVAVLKQSLEPLQGSKMFGVWARNWIKGFNETIAFCITTIRVERENER